MNSLVNWFCLIFVCIFSVVILAEENKHFYHMTVNEGSSLNGFVIELYECVDSKKLSMLLIC